MATHQTAETQYITANGIRLAFRRLGPHTGIPLVMLIHFRGNMDFWDPLLINTLLTTRPVLLIDIAGTGKSSGEVPTSMRDWASHVIALTSALSISKIDLLGFSMGGLAVQYVVLAAPRLVRKLIICGSRTSKTPNTLDGDLKWFLPLAQSESAADFKEAWVQSFFAHSDHGRAAAEASWARIMERRLDRAPFLTPELAKRQARAFAWTSVPDATQDGPAHPYERIAEFKLPVFVANGDDDLLVPTANSYELAQILPNAHLHIYPNSGHGFLFQYAEMFAKHVELFLDGPDGGERDLVAKL